MKLEKLTLKNKVLSKEAMAITFGGYTIVASNCVWSQNGNAECGDSSFD